MRSDMKMAQELFKSMDEEEDWRAGLYE